MNLTFQEWPKIHRLYRDVIITEKIDGTNACVCIVPLAEALPDPYAQFGPLAARYANGSEVGGKLSDGPGRSPGIVLDGHVIFAQSRKKVIGPGADNYGFATFVRKNASDMLRLLGPGRHFGEWYGKGIQGGYGASEKMLALFNVTRWEDQALPPRVATVPTLYEGLFGDHAVQNALDVLRGLGSQATGAALGAEAEGIIVYFKQSNTSFKVALENDAMSKNEARQRG